MSKNLWFFGGIVSLSVSMSAALHTARATESDDFSTRAALQKRGDAAPFLNKIIHQQLEGATNAFNASSVSCENPNAEWFFIRLLQLRLISVADVPSAILSPVSQVEAWMASTPKESEGLFVSGVNNLWTTHPWRSYLGEAPMIAPDFEAYGVRPVFSESIFAKLTNTWDDPDHGSLTLPTWKQFSSYVVPSLNLGGSVVGLDKIGHFFWDGQRQYLGSIGDKRSILDAMADSEDDESKVFGRGDGIWYYTTAGIYSYADLAANFVGMLFWYRLFHGSKPYLVCEADAHGAKKLTAGAEFKIEDYVSDLWDQGTNCSTYRDKVAAQILPQIQALGFTCPVVPKSCEKFASLPLSDHYLNPECLNSAAQAGITPAKQAEGKPWTFEALDSALPIK